MWTILTGIIFGVGAVILVKFGNPGNYGFCAACQLRDIAGSLGIHEVATLRYARPEIMGWILGAFLMAHTSGEFRSRGGASPLIRFLLGMAMMIGALAFLGCPLRSVLRLAGGDLNGFTGLLGFIAGAGCGIIFLRRGFALGKSNENTGVLKSTGYLLPALALVLLLAVACQSPWLAFSKQGPGAMHSPVLLSAGLGLLAGIAAQRTRLCMSGGIRDFFLTRDTRLLQIYGALFVAAIAANLYFGFFKLGFRGQPLAHTAHLWNFLGLFLVGMAAILAGGCPLRQLISSGQGSTDAAWAVVGMLAGAGVSHRLNAAGSATGVGLNGQIAVVIGVAVTLGIGLFFVRHSTVSGQRAAAAAVGNN